jgi:hypothetical protein
LKIISKLKKIDYSDKVIFRFYAVFFSLYYSIIFLSVAQIRNYESSAWRMIIDRVAANRDFGSDSFGRLLVIYPERYKAWVGIETEGLGVVNGRNMLKLIDHVPTSPEIYVSQFGLIGELASQLESILGFSILQIYTTLSFACILISSFIIAKVCLIFRAFLGKKADVLFAFCFLSPWAVIFAMNFYYFMFANMIFLIIPVLIHELGNRNKLFLSFDNSLFFAVVIFTSVFSLTNYTYVTVWASCLVIGLLIVSADRLISLVSYIKSFVALVIGVGLGITLHLIKVSEYVKSLKETSWVEYILRNKIGFTGSKISSEYVSSTSKSPFEVMHQYFSVPLLNSMVEERFHLTFFRINGYLALIFLICVLIYQRVRYGSPSTYIKNVLKLSFIAALGPLTWIFIMRPHSWDNVQVNYIFIFMPFLPLILSIILNSKNRFESKVNRIRVDGIFRIALVYLGLIVLFSWSVYFLTRT